MKITILFVTLIVTVMFSLVTMASDKVVVIPLGTVGSQKATGNAVEADVLEGKTFSSDTGVDQSGTMPDIGGVKITPSNQAQNIPEGYHDGTGTVETDSNLTPANIKDGTTIFGQPGTFTKETGNPMDAGDLLSGKIGYVNGSLVTGSVPAGVNINGTNGALSFTITDGLYSGNKTCTASDTNLTAANIKDGTMIFGQPGTYPLAKTAATGQTTSYTIGDDGDYEKGANVSGNRFTDNLDGTVTDNLTKLIWLKNANCFGQSTWSNAITSANTLADPACGLSDQSIAGDWRLPNVREIGSLLDFGNSAPALPTGYPFIGVVQSNATWWSSSSTASNPASYAWYLNLWEGVRFSTYKTTSYYVWPVRGGQ